jgi:hypothetical protein
VRPLVALALLCCAPPAATPPRADADVATADAAPCVEALELGRCVTTAGDECAGGAGEEPVFVPLDDGDEVHMVIGPQGSAMLVFGVRAGAMAPEGVAVELLLRAGGEELARMRAFRDLVPAGELLETNGLFLVLDGAIAAALDGAVATVEATAQDRAGIRACGARSLQISR